MTDLLIRGVPDEVVAAIEARASRLGLSRAEFLRREMGRVATGIDVPSTAESLRQFASTFADLDDSEVMSQAWQ